MRSDPASIERARRGEPAPVRPRRGRRCWFALAVAASLAGLAEARAAAAIDRSDALPHDGRTRTYALHLPASVAAGERPAALVVALHGGGGNAATSARQTGFDTLADREGFIVVHPDGSGAPHPLLELLGRGRFYTWNAGRCCGYAVEHEVDDVGYLRELVRRVQQQYAVDSRRIYAAGISNGGMMAYRLACEAGDVFAAIGVVAGAQVVSQCRPSAPVSVMHIHGTADENVPLAGGVGAKARDRVPKPPVMDAIRFWVQEDGIEAPPDDSANRGITTRRWYGGRNGSAVQLVLIDGGGHAWPGGARLAGFLDAPSQEIAATPLLWQFFRQHPKRGG